MVRLRYLNVEYVVDNRFEAERLMSEGYEVVEGNLDDLKETTGEDSRKADEPDFIDWNKMTVKELKAYAEENNIDLDGADTKAEIIARIEGE